MNDYNASTLPTLFPNDLLIAKMLLYDQCQLELTNYVAEAESREYTALSFHLNNFSIRYRIAKTTPTKTGQFVTLWKRIEKGPIQPFDVSDEIDFIIISTRKASRFGQFIFPKSVLLDNAIFSTKTKEGKRAIRVYPPWDEANNKQALKTQQWQADYFIDLSTNTSIDVVKAGRLFNIENSRK